MAKPTINNMAVFCDFENVALGVRDAKYAKFDIGKVLEKLLLKGSIVVKKAYCDWERYKEFKAPPDFFTAGGMAAAIAVVEALKKTGGDTATPKLIAAMEGMSFETPKGTMTFRKEDHQAMQSMYHFKIKVDPAFAWGVPELVREIKADEMVIPIQNKR